MSVLVASELLYGCTFSQYPIIHTETIIKSLTVKTSISIETEKWFILGIDLWASNATVEASLKTQGVIIVPI